MSRRKFVGTAAGAAAAGGIAAGFPNIALGATSIRTIGLGVSVMNELQGRASKDLCARIRGQALGYGALFGKMLNQNDQYEVAEHNFAELELFVPAKVWQPIDTHRIKNWDKVTDLCKTGRLMPEAKLGQGDAPFRHMWLNKDGSFAKGPSRYVAMVPSFHNADSIGYNSAETKREIDSWADLLSPDFKGQVALINVPQIGTMDAALAVEAMGLIKFGDKGNMTKKEIDFLVDYLIKKKKDGHFRAFWESFGQSVNLMVSGEVIVQSMWSPAVTAVKAEGIPCVYASPKEGMRAWHGGITISSRVTGKKLDAAYDYINWWLDGWAGAFVARQGYYMSTPDTVRKHLEPAEWDYWYDGKPAANELNDPFGNPVVPKGAVRDGGSYWARFKNIAVWNSLMDENQYLVKRWTEFLGA
jgi:putative spermidine/putrescine transport system substrate-binding protein